MTQEIGQDGLKARIESVGALIGARLFQPAAIQRDFNWEVSDCCALFEDIQRIFNDHISEGVDLLGIEGAPDAPLSDLEEGDDVALDGVIDTVEVEARKAPDIYFLGPMYLGLPKGGVSEIFDGLQRITSITILLSVIRDRLQGRNPAWADWLQAFVEDPQYGFRLTYPSGTHRETGTARFLREFAQAPGETSRSRQRIESNNPRGRVARAVREFRRLTDDIDQHELAAFAQFLLNRVMVIVIEIEDPRVASQAFVTSNMRGVPLRPADILKGRLMDIAGNEEGAAQVREAWEAIRQTPDMEGFMSAVDYLERRKQQGPTHLVDLGDHLAEARPGFMILEWMQRLDGLAASWRIMKTALADPQSDPFHGDLWRLGLMDWSEWRPLALHFIHVFERARKSSDTRRMGVVRKRFELFHRRAMAITLAGLGAKARHAIIHRALLQSEGLEGEGGNVRNCMSLKYGAMRLLPNQKDKARRQLDNGFENRESRSSFIKWLESLHWTSRTLPSYVAFGTVEHILPLTPAQNATQWQADFPDANERLGLTNMLGNLVLIDRETNSDAGSMDFQQKVELYRDMKPPYAMAHEIAERQYWRRDEILARTERLKAFTTDQLRWELEDND